MTSVRLICGDALEELRKLEAGSVQCCVTSPPYWSLRDYGVEGQLGLEATPQAYVERMVAVFGEVRRVLADDGTLWLNLGDSYASDVKGSGGTGRSTLVGTPNDGNGQLFQARRVNHGVKPKDLVGIPWMVARALQAPYYTGRIPRERDRVWLAAMVDAEGTICGFDHDRADGGGHRSGAHVAITNTSLALLDEAARIWSTSRSAHQRPHAGHLGTMESWRWIVHGIENKQAILRELYPYLVAKRQQAVVAYTLLNFMANAKRLGHSSQKDAVLAKRRILTSILSDLNHQRPVTLPDWLIEPPSLLEPSWYLRSDIIWAKPNPMPESVTDRPTKAHEYVFLLAKSARYYFDQEAVREPNAVNPDWNYGSENYRKDSTADHSLGPRLQYTKGKNGWSGFAPAGPNGNGRNVRSVWTIATEPYPEAHFATFPTALAERCILAGCPEQCCPVCGKGWVRVVNRVKTFESGSGRSGNAIVGKQDLSAGKTNSTPDIRMGPCVQVKTLGFRPVCDCGEEADSVPGTVLDPFAGSGTTLQVARALHRHAIGIELNPAYVALAERRCALPWERKAKADELQPSLFAEKE